MYIAPNSTIKLMATVPLDADYDNTILFDTIEDQQSFFNSKTIHTLTPQYYQRAERGYCRVKLPIKNCLSVNYMAFKNTDFTAAYYDKWFYAFVLNVEYINNEVTEIQYKIDVMQTYWFDLEILQSLVVREHIAKVNDKVGANIEPEPIQLSEYVGNEVDNIPGVDSCYVFILVNDTSIQSRNMYGGIYSGLLLYAYLPSDYLGIQDLINRYTQSPESIVAMYMAPSYGVNIGSGGSIADHLVQGSDWILPRDISGSTLDMTDTLDGYLPRNKKLYTYPFNFYNVYNGDGNSLSLRYEFFENLRPIFKLYETYLYPAELRLVPANYKNQAIYHLETISSSNYPQCAWSVDAFKNWIAREWFPILMKGVEVGVKSVAPMGNYVGMTQYDNGRISSAHKSYNSLTGRVVATTDVGPAIKSDRYQSATNILDFATSMLSDMYSASIQADITKGSYTGTTLSLVAHLKGFWGIRMSVVYNCARKIDDFLTRFGYATNLYKLPNFTGRTYFNYVKLSDVNVHVLPVRYCQQEHLEEFRNVLRHGITFWHDAANCGNFTPQIMETN